MTTGKRWTRDELMVALNLYHKLTFGQMHARQPAIMALAKRLGRGPNSLAMKLCNFASLDPALKMRGIKGLSGASSLDNSVWSEFHANLGETVPASEEAFRKLFDASEDSEIEVTPLEGVRVRSRRPLGPTEIRATVKVRRGQEYFRQAVLSNFGGGVVCVVSLFKSFSSLRTFCHGEHSRWSDSTYAMGFAFRVCTMRPLITG